MSRVIKLPAVLLEFLSQRNLRVADSSDLHFQQVVYDSEFESAQAQLNEDLRQCADSVGGEPVRVATDDTVLPRGEGGAPSATQVGGDHYSKLGAYQPWAVLAEWMTPAELRGFAKGTVIAYLAREGDKGGDQDIAKSLHTLQLFEQFRKDGK